MQKHLGKIEENTSKTQESKEVSEEELRRALTERNTLREKMIALSEEKKELMKNNQTLIEQARQVNEDYGQSYQVISKLTQDLEKKESALRKSNQVISLALKATEAMEDREENHLLELEIFDSFVDENNLREGFEEFKHHQQDRDRDRGNESFEWEES